MSTKDDQDDKRTQSINLIETYECGPSKNEICKNEQTTVQKIITLMMLQEKI